MVKRWQSVHMMSCLRSLHFTGKLSLHNLEASIRMRTRDFKRPFQYKKIPINELRLQQEKDKTNRARSTAGTIKRTWPYLTREKGMLLLAMLRVCASPS